MHQPDPSLNNNNNNFVEPQFLVASSMIPEDLCRHSFSGGSPLLMARLMNIVVIPAGTRDESGQDVSTGGQVMELLRRDALLPRLGQQINVRYGSSRGGSRHQAAVLLIPGCERQPSGGSSLLLMSRPTNREVVPAGTRDESGQYMLTGGQVMDPRRDALSRSGGQVMEHLELAPIPAGGEGDGPQNHSLTQLASTSIQMHQPVLIPEDLRRHSFCTILFTTTGGGSLLLMSRPTNREVVPAGDESGQYMLTGGQVMEVLRRDALLPRFGPQIDVRNGSSRGSSPHQAEVPLIPGWDRQPSGGVSLQALREMELVPYDFGPQSHVLDHSLAVAGIPEHLELALIPAMEIEDDVGSQTDAFNDLPHQEEPPVEWVINVGQSSGNSEEAPASMRNHAMVKKLTEELPKIMIPLCGATNIALVSLKVNGYSNDNSIIPLEFVGIVNAVAFAGFMAGFSLDKIAPKIANFSTQSGIALTTVSVFSLSSWIFSVKAIVVPAFFGVLALGTWGISRS